MSRCKACWPSCLFLPFLPLSVLSLWLSPVMTVMSTMGPGDGISLLYQSALAPEPQDRNECLAHVASVHLLLRENEGRGTTPGGASTQGHCLSALLPRPLACTLPARSGHMSL